MQISGPQNPTDDLMKLYTQLDNIKKQSQFKNNTLNSLSGENLSKIILLKFGEHQSGQDVKIKEMSLWNRLVLLVRKYTKPNYVDEHSLYDDNFHKLQSLFSQVVLEQVPQDQQQKLQDLQKSLNHLFQYIIEKRPNPKKATTQTTLSWKKIPNIPQDSNSSKKTDPHTDRDVPNSKDFSEKIPKESPSEDIVPDKLDTNPPPLFRAKSDDRDSKKGKTDKIQRTYSAPKKTKDLSTSSKKDFKKEMTPLSLPDTQSPKESIQQPDSSLINPLLSDPLPLQEKQTTLPKTTKTFKIEEIATWTLEELEGVANDSAIIGGLATKIQLQIFCEIADRCAKNNYDKKAADYYQKAVNLVPETVTYDLATWGSALGKARYEIGNRLLNGLGIEKNEAQAIRYLDLAVAGREKRAMLALGELYEKKGDMPKAVIYYQKAVKLNDSKAHWKMGHLYLEGRGLNQDRDEAIQCFIRAAADNPTEKDLYAVEKADAATYLSMLYEETSADKKSAEYAQKAATKGNTDAMILLGLKHENGKGIGQDRARAMTLYKNAAEKGNVRAYVHLGRCYEKGIGVLPDAQQAAFYYTQGANHNDKEAQFYLGQSYERGNGVVKDTQKAIEYYKQSAQQNFPDAQKALDRLQKST